MPKPKLLSGLRNLNLTALAASFNATLPKALLDVSGRARVCRGLEVKEPFLSSTSPFQTHTHTASASFSLPQTQVKLPPLPDNLPSLDTLLRAVGAKLNVTLPTVAQIKSHADQPMNLPPLQLPKNMPPREDIVKSVKDAKARSFVYVIV